MDGITYIIQTKLGITRCLTRRRENRGFSKSLVVHEIIRRRWSAHRADCDSQHEKEINSHFLLMSAILAAQQPAFGSLIHNWVFFIAARIVYRWE
jgi:hypothetical protein